MSLGVLNLQKASFATEPYFRMDTISGNYALSGSRPRKNAEAVQRVSKDCRLKVLLSLTAYSFWMRVLSC